jgi:hypothetical protein
MRLAGWLPIAALALAGCAELPVRAEPFELPPDPGGGAPTRGLVVEWTRDRPLAEPWYVVFGDRVQAAELDPGRRTLAWYIRRAGPLDASPLRFEVQLRLGERDVQEGLVARSHTLIIGGLRGSSADHALVVEGSRVPVASRDAEVRIEYPHRLPGSIAPAGRLRVTRHLDPELRARATVQRHLGFDLRLEADGTIRKLDRATPPVWEQAAGLPYPGAVIVRDPPEPGP